MYVLNFIYVYMYTFHVLICRIRIWFIHNLTIKRLEINSLLRCHKKAFKQPPSPFFSQPVFLHLLVIVGHTTFFNGCCSINRTESWAWNQKAMLLLKLGMKPESNGCYSINWTESWAWNQKAISCSINILERKLGMKPENISWA